MTDPETPNLGTPNPGPPNVGPPNIGPPNVQSPRARCTCAYCRLNAARGPVILITVGVIFLVGQYTRYGFGDLWPVLLIVVGAIAVAQAFASRGEHTGS